MIEEPFALPLSANAKRKRDHIDQELLHGGGRKIFNSNSRGSKSFNALTYEAGEWI